MQAIRHSVRRRHLPIGDMAWIARGCPTPSSSSSSSSLLPTAPIEIFGRNHFGTQRGQRLEPFFVWNASCGTAFAAGQLWTAANHLLGRRGSELGVELPRRDTSDGHDGKQNAMGVCCDANETFGRNGTIAQRDAPPYRSKNFSNRVWRVANLYQFSLGSSERPTAETTAALILVGIGLWYTSCTSLWHVTLYNLRRAQSQGGTRPRSRNQNCGSYLPRHAQTGHILVSEKVRRHCSSLSNLESFIASLCSKPRACLCCRCALSSTKDWS